MDKEQLNVPASALPPVEDEWLNEPDFRTSSNWRVFRIMAEFVEGWNFLADYRKTVTIFGSARTEQDSKWYNEAHHLARMLAESGFSVVTGGGPGIMEAANRGAWEVKRHAAGGTKKIAGESIGLDIQLPREQRTNRYVSKSRGFNYFFVRKVMLSYHAEAYVYFPGGFGTLDEAFEILTLIQTRKVAPVPVIFVGKDFWSPLAEWMEKAMLGKYKTIHKEELEIYQIVDSAKSAHDIIGDWYRRKNGVASANRQA